MSECRLHFGESTSASCVCDGLSFLARSAERVLQTEVDDERVECMAE